MPFAHPWQTTATAGLPCCFLFAVLNDNNLLQVIAPVKWTADCPVVRDSNVPILADRIVLLVKHGELPVCQQTLLTNGLLFGRASGE